VAPLQSYLHNLNTSAAYHGLREARAFERSEGQAPSGYAMAGGLLSYSERGQAYVDELRGIMRVNHLKDYEEAELDPKSGATMILPANRGPDAK